MDHKKNQNQIYYSLSLKTRKKAPRKLPLSGSRHLLALKNIINIALKNAKYIKSHKYNNVDIFKLLDKIIPRDYFGITKHMKIFYMIVKKILTQSNNECIYLSALVKRFDFQSIPWLSQIAETDCEKYLLKGNLFMLDRLVKPLIYHYYYSIKTFFGHEIKFIERKKWQSFYSKAVNKHIQLNHLVPSENIPCNLARGVLLLVPKDDCETLQNRPLVSIYQDESMKKKYGGLSVKIYKFAQKQKTFSTPSLFLSWQDYVKSVGNQKIYAAKVDIEDAFGNIDIELLIDLVNSCNEDILGETEKKFIVDHIEHQYIVLRSNKRVPIMCQWKHGLLQGDRLSSSLCELYMSYLDRVHLKEFSKTNCFLHRTVDDFVFFSTKDYKVERFLYKMSCIYVLNDQKTMEVSEKSKQCELIYYGYKFNIRTKEVRKNFQFEKTKYLRHKFKLWNTKQPIPECNGSSFLKRALKFGFNNNSFSKISLNTIFNTEETVLRNFFDGMIFLAFKFDTAFMAIEDNFSSYQFVVGIIQNTIKEYCNRILFQLKVHKGIYDKNNITFNLLNSVGHRAFILVMKKRCEVYKNIIQEIQKNHALFLNLELLNLKFSYFNSLPEYFKNINVKRVPYII